MGERNTIAERMRYRYDAKLEYIRSEARQMLQRTLHNRTRRLLKTEIGQMVLFWRDNQHKNKQLGTRCIGPAFVVGHQGNNDWVTCGAW